jgi:septum site-determining protein MinD
MIGFISSRSLRAEKGLTPVLQRLLVTRYDPSRAEKGECLKLEDIQEVLGIPVIGVIPESPCVLTSTNMGQPVITEQGDKASEAYRDMVRRFLGEDVPLRYVKPEEKGFFTRLFGK